MIVGKTIKSYDIGMYGGIVFTDDSSIEFDADYSGCYYENDMPSLRAKYRPTEHELKMKRDEITKWFKERPARQKGKFNIFLNSGTIARTDILEQKIKEIG